MNLITREIFGGTNKRWNTFIGGVSSTISTSAQLATKLGISNNRITNFAIVGSDIKCKITGSYANTFGFYDNELTYYDDKDGLCTSAGYIRGCPNLYYWNTLNVTSFSSGYFGRECPLLKEAIFPNIINIYNSQFYESNCDLFYIPRATTLGSTVGDNQVFNGIFFLDNVPKTIYCHPSLATNNAGAPDGDIAYAISQGATVRYVTNFTAPNPVTTLSAGTVYNTAIQLNFTPPSSTNAIEYYECYVNGVLKNTITASGQYITGLTPSTNYDITLKAVDIFYNKSVVSNTVTQSTNATSYLESRTIAAYSLATNGVDAKNAYNGTVGAGVTFSSGAVFTNTTNSNIIIPDNNAFSFGNGTNDLPFSISFKINFSSVSASQWIVNKRLNSGASDEWAISYDASGLFYFLLLSNSGAAYIYITYSFTPTTGVDYIFTFTYSGGGVSGMKIYRDGSLVTTTPNTVGTYTKMPNGTAPVTIGAQGWNLTGARLTAKLKELYFFNDELTSTEVAFLQTSNYPF